MPFLGILDDHKLPHVPGTVILEEQAAHSEAITGGLKHGSGRNAHIVLIPQPSHDPNDPLNWSTTKKLTALGVTSFGAILYACVISAMLNPAFYVISLQLNTTIAALVSTTGYQTLVVGVTGPIFNAIARKYGKRPLFLFGSLICLVSSIVGSCVNSYKGVLVSRVLQGFAIAPYESLIFTLISDMFFVHERGLYTSWINFMLAGISNLTAVVSGPIVTNLGWRYLYYLLVLFGAIQTIMQFLLVPETSYIRDHRYEIDEIVNDNLQDLAALEHKTELADEKHMGLSHNEANVLEPAQTRSTLPPAAPPKKTFVQELAVYTGSYSNENFLQLFIAPFAVFSNLAVFWILMVNSWFVCLYVFIAFVISQIFAAPPYLLNPTTIGYLSFGPFVGGVLGTIILAALSDPWIKWCARRNNGVYEPEYRLIPCLVGVLSGAGLLGYGYLAAEGKSPAAVATMHGIMLFGVMFMCIGSSTYAIDAYRDMTAEIFIASMTTKNMLLYGFSYFVNSYTATAGVKHVFTVWAAIAFALSATVPVMFIFGKKYRSWWARNNLLAKWHIRTHEE